MDENVRSLVRSYIAWYTDVYVEPDDCLPGVSNWEVLSYYYGHEPEDMLWPENHMCSECKWCAHMGNPVDCPNRDIKRIFTGKLYCDNGWLY